MASFMQVRSSCWRCPELPTARFAIADSVLLWSFYRTGYLNSAPTIFGSLGRVSLTIGITAFLYAALHSKIKRQQFNRFVHRIPAWTWCLIGYPALLLWYLIDTILPSPKDEDNLLELPQFVFELVLSAIAIFVHSPTSTILLDVRVAVLVVCVLAGLYYLMRVDSGILQSITTTRYTRLQQIYEDNSKAYKESLKRSWLWDRSRIRVLEIHNGAFNDTLRGSLSIVDIDRKDEGPSYAAISWAWGDCIEIKNILVDNTDFVVPVSAYEVLRRLRTIHAEAEPRRVWIDCVCINHADVEEEQQQLQMMSKVYANASKVVVWLGPCGYHKRDTEEHCNNHPSDTYLHQVNRHLPPLVVEQDATRLQWWWRTWTIQEAVLGTTLEVIVGDHRYGWNEFVNIAASVALIPAKLASHIITLNEMRRKFHQPSVNNWLDIQLIHQHSKDSQAERAHDKVYALLGLLHPYSIARSVSVDYNAPLFDLNIMMSYALLNEGDRGLLSLFAVERRLKGSSWALDFTTTVKEQQEEDAYELDAFDFAMKHEPTLYLTNQSEITPSRIRRDGATLILRGHNFDKIVFSADRSSVTSGLKSRPWARMKARLPRDQSRALIDDTTQQFEQEALNAAKAYLKGSGSIYQYLPSAEIPTANSCWNTSGRLPHLQKRSVSPWRLRDKLTGSKWKSEFKNYARSVCESQDSFFVTRRGFVGLAQRPLQVSDLVCLIHGCTIPIILRPETADYGSAYRLVGGAYICGVMRGECGKGAILDMKNLSERDFKIL